MSRKSDNYMILTKWKSLTSTSSKSSTKSSEILPDEAILSDNKKTPILSPAKKVPLESIDSDNTNPVHNSLPESFEANAVNDLQSTATTHAHHG